jgi:putative ABC transport system permease protein
MSTSISFIGLVRRSIRRRLFRNIATVACFAFITGSILTAYFLVGGAQNSVRAGMERLGADILVVPEQAVQSTEAVILTGVPTTFVFDTSVAAEVAAIPGVERIAPQVFVASLANAPCCSYSLQLIGVDPLQDFTIRPWLQASLQKDLQQDEVIVGNLILGDVGDKLEFFGHNFTIAGRLEATGMGIDTAVFMRIQDAYVMAAESAQKAVVKLDLQAGQISAVLVKISSGADANEVQQSIVSQIPGAAAIVSGFFAASVSGQLSATTQALYFVAFSVTLVAVPLVALIAIMVANERRKEMGIMRALGGNRSFIFRLVVVESMVLAGIGASIGVIASASGILLFQGVVKSSLGIPFLPPPIQTVVVNSAMVSLLAITIGAVCSLYPAFRVSHMEPYQAIRKGEI